MELIGMLDSPYVRRVAITMQVLDIKFTHRAMSVFRDFDSFRKINPLVKAPTLITDDNSLLVDSSLIIQYLERVADKSLLPVQPDALSKSLRLIGLALNLCDKSVQYYYEVAQRPQDRQHLPWLERVTEQLGHACNGLEQEFDVEQAVTNDGRLSQVGITTAVAYKFAEQILPANALDIRQFTQLTQFSDEMEKRIEFKRAAFGDKPFPVA